MAQSGLSFWHPANLIATFFGLGRVPFAPGTFGSLAAYLLLPVVLPLSQILQEHDAPFADFHTVLLLMALTAVVFVIGLWSCRQYIKHTASSDPKEVIIDEVAGQLFTFALVYLPFAYYFYGLVNKGYAGFALLSGLILPFLTFRLFDISKFSVVGWLDRHVKGAWGIMLDDMAAGLLAALTCTVFFLGALYVV